MSAENKRTILKKHGVTEKTRRSQKKHGGHRPPLQRRYSAATVRLQQKPHLQRVRFAGAGGRNGEDRFSSKGVSGAHLDTVLDQGAESEGKRRLLEVDARKVQQNYERLHVRHPSP